MERRDFEGKAKVEDEGRRGICMDLGAPKGKSVKRNRKAAIEWPPHKMRKKERI